MDVPRPRPVRAIALAVAALLLAAPGAGAAVGDLVVVANTSEQDYGEVDQIAHRPAISADGRFIAFVAQSGGTGDPLFLRDMDAAAPVVVASSESKRWPGFDALRPDLSADGRFLAFASTDPLISGEDVDADGGHQVEDVFVYDRKLGRTRLVSRRSGRDGAPGDRDSEVLSISGDGRTIAYDTSSYNLGGGVIGGIYLRNLRTERNELVFGASGDDFWAPSSSSPDVSGDGRRVAFTLQYTDTPFDPNFTDREILRWLRHRHRQIALADSGSPRLRILSRASGRRGALGNRRSRTASVSANGRFVAFVSDASNLVEGDQNEASDVFVRDLRRNRTLLASRVGTSGPAGDAGSAHPSISSDGRFVAFLSAATNFAPGGNGKPNVFVKDLDSGRLRLASKPSSGEAPNGRSGGPAITSDGRFVAFGSTSSNLSPEDNSHDLSFYRLQLRP